MRCWWWLMVGENGDTDHAYWYLLPNPFSPRRGFSKGAKETLGSQEAGCSRDTAYIIYTTLSMSVDALDGLRTLTFGSKEIFWEVTIHHKRTSATFYARPTRINIPARSISAVRYEKWPKSRIWESRIWRLEIAQGCPPRVSWPV